MRPSIITRTLLISLILISSVYAFTTLSLSNVDFSFSQTDSDFQKAFLLLISEDGRSDFATGIFRENTKVDNIQTKNSFELKTQISNTQCKYTISDTKEIKKLQVEKFTHYLALWGWEKDEQNCRNKGGQWYRNLGYDGYCITSTNEAVSGILTDKTFSFKEIISATVQGETQSVAISNDDSIAPKSAIVNDKISARYGGSLTSGRECPLQQGIRATNIQGRWILTDEGDYQRYIDSFTTNFDTCIKIDVGKITGNPINCVNEHNDLVDLTTRQKIFSTNNLFSKTSFALASQGKVLINDVDLLQFPVLTIKLDADWVGIIQPVTRPKIISLISEEFTEGKQGFIVAIVKNEGEAGSMSLSISCPSVFTTSATEIFKIGKGETRTLNIPLNAETEKESEDGTCTVRLQDESDPSIFDSKTVKVTVKDIVLCSPEGTKRCNGNFIEVCKDRIWATIKECDGSCIIEKEELICQGDKPTSKPILQLGECKDVLALPEALGSLTIVPNLSEGCLNILTGFFEKAQFFLALVGFIFTSFFTWLMFKGGRILTNKKGSVRPIAYIWIIVFGFIVHLLIANFLIAGLIVWVAYSLIAFTIRSIKKKIKAGI